MCEGMQCSMDKPPPPYKNMRMFLFFVYSYLENPDVQCSPPSLFAEIWQS